MGKNNQPTGGYVVKQRAFLKLYLLKYIEERKGYGNQFLEDLRTEFKLYEYVPSHSEVYKALLKMTRDGLVRREERLLGEPGVDFQEIIIYHLTDKGKDEYDLFKKQMKVELERSVGMLNKAIKDHYGPVR